MKNLLIYLCLFFAVATFTQAPTVAFAQSKKAQKAEKKKWKGIAKNYKRNPLALKAKEEAYQSQISNLTEKNNELQQRYTALQAEVDNLEAQLRRCKTSVDSANAEYQRLQAAYEVLKEQASRPDVATAARGLIFRVQIGAYEKFNMNQYAGQTGSNFTGESYDALNKFLIGEFRDYNMAQAFRRDIIKLGIRDAWVVAYSDGTRIDIKEAMRMQGAGQ